MWTLLAILFLGTATAAAGDGSTAAQVAVQVRGDKVVAIDAARAPRSAAMIGASCSFRTSNMARRVMAEGEDYAYMGTLLAATETAEGDVACPYRIGSEDGACVVATELVEYLEQEGMASRELNLEGRTLELDGVRYVVLTAYRPTSS